MRRRQQRRLLKPPTLGAHTSGLTQILSKVLHGSGPQMRHSAHAARKMKLWAMERKKESGEKSNRVSIYQSYHRNVAYLRGLEEDNG